MRRFYEAVKSGLHCNAFCTKSKMPVVTTAVKFPSMWERGDGDDQIASNVLRRYWRFNLFNRLVIGSIGLSLISGLHCNAFCTKSKMPVVTTTVKFPSM